MKRERIIETRRLLADDLRSLCIKKNWYTSGTGKEYDRLLTGVANCTNITTEAIQDIAMDIINHTESLSCVEITDVMWYIAQECHSWFSRFF